MAVDVGIEPRCRGTERRVVDHIVEQLAASGVTHVFGVDGANIEDVFDAAHFRDDITAVLAKHEFSAAAMADGYSRVTGRLGVVAATSGGGALNLVPGLGESFASRVPVLALVGQAPTVLDGRGSFQDTSGRGGALDATALFGAVSVFCERVTRASDIVEVLPRAIAAALRGGPAVLLLPKDIQQQLIGEPHLVRGRSTQGEPAFGDPRPIVRALRQAQGPVTIIAGEQIARDDARAELERLRMVLGARIACVPDAKDVGGVPGSGAASSLGVTGAIGHPGVVEAIAGSAVCLVVGTRLPAMARTGLDDVLGTVKTFSMGSARPYFDCTHVQTEDLRRSLDELTDALGHDAAAGVPDLVPHTELRPPSCAAPGIRYRDAMVALDKALPDGANIVADAGNTGAAAVHYLPVRRDGRFVVALGMGGMGYSFGAGIGMAFGRPRRTVIVSGDGSFFMHGLELHTAIQYRLPVTVVLLNNNAHAMCVNREQLFYGDAYSYNRFTPSRLGAGLAAMFPGLRSVDVDSTDQLAAALSEALHTDGPSVVSIECSADEIPPFAPFLAAIIQQEGLINVSASA